MKTVLLVGLGNPGKEYERTRHNAGFMFVDYFFEKYRDDFGFSEWEEKKKLKSAVSIAKSGSMKIILAKPQTFMNLSGDAVSALIKFYKIKPSDLIVSQDEIDLPLGKYKFSTDSSSAGHKGAQDIIESLKTQNFTRLRLGVDHRGEKKIATEKYVLGKFSKEERGIVDSITDQASGELLRKLKVQSSKRKTTTQS